MDKEDSFNDVQQKQKEDESFESPPPQDFMNALYVLNGDMAIIIRLIEENFQSRIFGNVGEHLVFLRKKDKLKEICEYLNDDKIIETSSYQLNQEIETFYPKTDEARSFVKSFLNLAKLLNYQEIILFFDPTSIRDPVKSGLLKKYTNVVKQYKTRYVVLFDDTLAYYKIKNSKRFLRKKISFDSICNLRARNKKLIISTYDEKIIFKSDPMTIQTWYKLIDTKLDELKVSNRHETQYLLNLLYFNFSSSEREELIKYENFNPFLLFFQQETEIQPFKSDQDVFYDFKEESSHIDTFFQNYFKCLTNYEHCGPNDDRFSQFYTSSSNIDSLTLPERLAEFPHTLNDILFSFFNNPQKPNIHIEVLLIYSLLKFVKDQSDRLTPRLIPDCNSLEIHNKEKNQHAGASIKSFVTIKKHKFILTSVSKYLDFTLDLIIKPLYENSTEMHIKNRSKAVIHIKHSTTSLNPFVFTFPDLIITDRIHFKHSSHLHHDSAQYSFKLFSTISHQLVIESTVYQIETSGNEITVRRNCELVDMENIGNI